MLISVSAKAGKDCYDRRGPPQCCGSRAAQSLLFHVGCSTTSPSRSYFRRASCHWSFWPAFECRASCMTSWTYQTTFLALCPSREQHPLVHVITALTAFSKPYYCIFFRLGLRYHQRMSRRTVGCRRFSRGPKIGDFHAGQKSRRRQKHADENLAAPKTRRHKNTPYYNYADTLSRWP